MAFKAKLVKRMLNGATVSGLARETGLSKQTLSRWRQDAHRLPLMADKHKETDRLPERWRVEEKARIVAEAGALEGEELGAYLRREGVHPDQLAAWRRALADGYDQDKATKREISQLKRELRRKDRALAEAAALAVLKKKLSVLWEEEGDDTTDESES
jgi:transposase